MKRIFAIFLTLLLLTSNSGVVFATHYCMGEIENVSIGFTTEAHKCDMADMGRACMHESNQKEDSMKSEDCCKDDFVQIQLNESFDSPNSTQPSLDNDFLVAFTLVYFNLFNFQAQTEVGSNAYSPPLLQQDIPVLFQSFLI